MIFLSPSRLAFLVLVVLTGPVFGQQVHQVDELGTGGAFTDVQPAIDAAADGDVVLIANGTYGGFTIDGKGVHVMADSGTLPLIKGPMIVRNVAANQSVALHGLIHEIYVPLFQFPSLTPVGPILDIDNCLGVVHVQDCDLSSTDTLYNSPAGLRATNVAELVIESCVINSLDGSSLNDSQNLYAVDLQDSNAYIYGCTLVGTRGVYTEDEGGVFPVLDDLVGSPALLIRGGTALIVDSQLTGGSGSTGFTNTTAVTVGFGCLAKGAGGPAIRLDNGNSAPLVTQIVSTFTPGVAGDLGSFIILGNPINCVGGPAALNATELLAGSISDLSLTPRGYRGTALTRPGEVKSMTFTGQPFDMIWILYSLNPGMNITTPVLPGVGMRTSEQFLFYMGKLNAAGTRTRTLTLNPIGVDYLPLFEQAFYINLTDGLTSSNPRVAGLIGLSVP